MGFTSALTYDFEVYSAAQEKWLEVSSVSNFESFQTNRMKTRYKDAGGKTQLLPLYRFHFAGLPSASRSWTSPHPSSRMPDSIFERSPTTTHTN